MYRSLCCFNKPFILRECTEEEEENINSFSCRSEGKELLEKVGLYLCGSMPLAEKVLMARAIMAAAIW